MEGTFAKPMPIGDGKSIPPTGQPLSVDRVHRGSLKERRHGRGMPVLG
jgi:hypothetical protein